MEAGRKFFRPADDYSLARQRAAPPRDAPAKNAPGRLSQSFSVVRKPVHPARIERVVTMSGWVKTKNRETWRRCEAKWSGRASNTSGRAAASARRSLPPSQERGSGV